MAGPLWFGWDGKHFLIRRVSITRTRVVERFPLDEGGFAQAWSMMSSSYPELAAALRVQLKRHAVALNRGALEEAGRAELSEHSIVAEANHCQRVRPPGKGDDDEDFPFEIYCTLTFTEEGLWVRPDDGYRALLRAPYGEIEGIQLTGSGPPPRDTAELMALGGFGAEIDYSITKAILGNRTRSAQTLIHLSLRQSDVFFVCRTAWPDDLRVRLSKAIRRIKGPESAGASRSLVDELERLAGLHTSGALSDEEYGLLKSKLIAES